MHTAKMLKYVITVFSDTYIYLVEIFKFEPTDIINPIRPFAF